MTDRKTRNTLAKIRRAAAKVGETIRTGKDAYGAKGYMTLDAWRNIIIDGEGFTLSLEDLAHQYQVTL